MMYNKQKINPHASWLRIQLQILYLFVLHVVDPSEVKGSFSVSINPYLISHFLQADLKFPRIIRSVRFRQTIFISLERIPSLTSKDVWTGGCHGLQKQNIQASQEVWSLFSLSKSRSVTYIYFNIIEELAVAHNLRKETCHRRRRLPWTLSYESLF